MVDKMDKLPKRKLHRLKNYDYSSNGCYFITICTGHFRHILGEIRIANADNMIIAPGLRISCNRIASNMVNPEDNIPYILPGTPYVLPSQIGEFVIKCWDKMSEIDENIYTTFFSLMPNHIHGIIVINNQETPENGCEKYVGSERRGRRSVQEMVRGFKSACTRLYNYIAINDHNGLWHPSFHDRIIRNEDEYNAVAEYIINNPLKWDDDEYNKKEGL